MLARVYATTSRHEVGEGQQGVLATTLDGNGNLVGRTASGRDGSENLSLEHGFNHGITTAQCRLGDRDVQWQHHILTGLRGRRRAEAVTVRVGQKADGNGSGDGGSNQKSVRHVESSNIY